MAFSAALSASRRSCARRAGLVLVRAVTASLVLAALGGSAQAQSPFATQIVAYAQGSGGGIFDPANALGGPQGGGLDQGSLHVLSLGQGGELTLGFDVAIQDGRGADFTVFENGFVIAGGGGVFAEVCYVEVSTDGAAFARFPSKVSAAGGSAMGTYSALCGGMPVIADVTTGLVDPLDPAVSGGEAFDLAELAQHPLVQAGLVQLDDVNYVRVVDAPPGSLDAFGAPITDSGAADIDAVAVLHSDASPANGPVCDLFVDAAGRVHLVIGDPDGLFTLDFASLHASVNLAGFPLSALLSVFDLESFTGTEAHLATPSLAGSGLLAAFAISVRDQSGALAGDQLMLQGDAP